jgi:putative spermidine/putrescine transport system permease protein
MLSMRAQSSGAAWLLAPAVLICLSLFAALLVIARFSLNTWSPATGMVSDWTLANYAAFFGDSFNARILGVTFRISILVTLLALILGYPLAYLLARTRYKKLILFVITVPLLMDILVRAYGWVVLLSGNGLVNKALLGSGLIERPIRFIGTETAVVLELLHEVIPLMVLPIARVLERIEPSVTEAAVGLGAGAVSVFLRIVLPLSLPGVVAGTLLTFGIAASAFAAPLILGGGRVPMISISITQQMTSLLNWPAGATQAIILLFIVSILMTGYGRAVDAGVRAR